MSVHEILQLGNPALRASSIAVDEPDSEATRALGADLADTLLDHRGRTGYGRGIAAPCIEVVEQQAGCVIVPGAVVSNGIAQGLLGGIAGRG